VLLFSPTWNTLYPLLVITALYFLVLALQKQRLEVEKARVQRERAEEKLKKLLADREMMTVKSPAEMKPYTNTIPGTAVTYEMVPIAGGEFVMGSPDAEKDRKPEEGPQHKVGISPFWMGRYEVTWDQYLLFMYPDDEKKLRETHATPEEVNQISDAVTRPSKPYVDMSFGMGKAGFPAIAMTHHAANKFCHWLSAKTGQFYRLPTEAEWEYACRAGTGGTRFLGMTTASYLSMPGLRRTVTLVPEGRKEEANPWGYAIRERGGVGIGSV
jgi:formylglycine-generating enzyme required for sulfatase activity